MCSEPPYNTKISCFNNSKISMGQGCSVKRFLYWLFTIHFLKGIIKVPASKQWFNNQYKDLTRISSSISLFFSSLAIRAYVSSNSAYLENNFLRLSEKIISIATCLFLQPQLIDGSQSLFIQCWHFKDTGQSELSIWRVWFPLSHFPAVTYSVLEL